MYFAQFGIDRVIEERYFPKDYIGNCIEVGAADGVTISNTYYFERKGWNALCIEPQPGFFNECKSKRKLALNYAISSEESQGIPFNMVFCKPPGDTIHRPWNGMSGLELDHKLLEQHKNMGYDPIVREILVETKRLDWCIEKFFNHKTIDFISIDVEGTELDVLKSFDINQYNTKLILLENNFDDPEVEQYMNSLGWVKDNRIEVNDFYIKKV